MTHAAQIKEIEARKVELYNERIAHFIAQLSATTNEEEIIWAAERLTWWNKQLQTLKEGNNE